MDVHKCLGPIAGERRKTQSLTRGEDHGDRGGSRLSSSSVDILLMGAARTDGGHRLHGNAVSTSDRRAQSEPLQWKERVRHSHALGIVDGCRGSPTTEWDGPGRLS